ncbi:MAG: PH domain-containing protein [Candidatus Aenigmatarchaeota archaeon]
MEVKASYLSFLINYILIILGVFAISLIYFSFGNPFYNFNLTTIVTTIIILGIILLIDEIFYRRLYTYEIGKNGIMEKFKFISKKEKFISYQNITEVNLSKNFLDRILNIGNIEVIATNAKIILKGVKNPEKIYQEIVSKSNIEKEEEQ